MDKNLITELWLPRVKIPLKPIISFIKENILRTLSGNHRDYVKFFIDIQGYTGGIYPLTYSAYPPY